MLFNYPHNAFPLEVSNLAGHSLKGLERYAVLLRGQVNVDPTVVVSMSDARSISTPHEQL